MRKKLLFVNGHLNVGGVEKSLTDLLRHLDYSKYEVDLLLLEDTGDYCEQIPDGVNIILKPTVQAYGPLWQILKDNLLSLHFWPLLYRLVLVLVYVFGKRAQVMLRLLLSLNKRYDVAIAYRPGVCADTVAYTAKANKKIVWWHHGECNVDEPKVMEYSHTWQRFDNVVTVSKTCKDMLARTFNYPIDNIIVIPNMIDCTKISEAAGIQSPFTNTSINLVSVGRLCVEKHFEDAVYVARKLLDNGVVNFHWHIIGDGDLRDELADKILQQGVGAYITLLGKKANPYPWMKHANIYVHPSYVESQCITVLEAMALGTPCVVCRSAGPSEFMRDGENGIVTEPTPEDLYEGVLRMLCFSDRNSLIQAAKDTVYNGYNPNRIVGQFEAIIEEVKMKT